MKNENPSFKKTFGLSHIDMGILLCISRSLYSMFVTGKRSLPKSALMILATIELHLAKEMPNFKPQKYTYPNEESETKEWLVRKLSRIHYQLKFNEKKQKELLAMRTKGYVKLDFASLMKSAELSENVTKGVLHIRIEGIQKLRAYSLQKKMKLEIEKEALEAMQKAVAERLKILEEQAGGVY